MRQALTILFSDVANSTRLYQSHGDVIAHRLITDCLHSLRGTVEHHGGKLLRTVGDAVLASFDSPEDALRAAIESQRVQLASALTIRIGFHLGDVIPDDGDVYGNAVNIAARVASFANAGEIYTTEDTVHKLSHEMRRKTTFLDHIEFKGIERPMSVYRIQWQEESTSNPSADTRIVTVVNRKEAYRSDVRLKLLIGAKSIVIDESNPRVSIGRDTKNDIVINHDSTSRNHALVEFYRGRYTITDSSTNGTYIVKSGKNVVFVRRESLVLESDGMIGAGWRPQHADFDKIGFRTVRQSLSEFS